MYMFWPLHLRWRVLHTHTDCAPIASQAILPVFRGDIGIARDGRPFVTNLFKTFKSTRLPDRVNEPTLARLTQFLTDHKMDAKVRAPTLPAFFTLFSLVSESSSEHHLGSSSAM